MSTATVAFRFVPGPRPQVTGVDAAIAELTGFPAEAFLADPGLLFRVVHPDDLGVAAGQLLGRGPTSVRVRWCHRDGRTLPVDQVAVVDRSVEGRPLLVHGTVTRVEPTDAGPPAEAAPTGAPPLGALADLFEQAAVGMALLDPGSGRVLAATPFLAALLGVDRPSLLGRAPTDVVEGWPELDWPWPPGARVRDEVRVRRAGGDEWLLVDLAPATVAGGPVVVLQAVEITDRKQAELDLTRAAMYDPLTGLANRRLLLDRLALELARSARSGEELAVLFVDLDDFKEVNDRRGHRAGDLVLREVAHRLQHAVRSSDTVARLGGDEFVVLASQVRGDPSAHHLAGRIVDLLGRPIPVDDGPVVVGASVGLVVIADGHRTPDEVLRLADEAMYGAKGAGKGRWSSAAS